jgi:hypothetical protein
MKLALCLGLWIAVASAFAQWQKEWEVYNLYLLGRPSVEIELGLTKQQVRQLRDAYWYGMVAVKVGPSMEGDPPRREHERQFQRNQVARLLPLLTQPQRERFLQISLQTMGFRRAVSNPGIALRLGITAEQVERISQIAAEERARHWAVIVQVARESEHLTHRASDSSRRRLERITVDIEQKMFDLLTVQQKVKWAALQGRPFTNSSAPTIPKAPPSDLTPGTSHL